DASALRLRDGGLGAALAGRGDLGRTQARMTAAVAPLLLASTSPQRRAILAQLGIPFELAAPVYDEQDDPDADPVALVREHALGKARSVAAGAGESPVLGVDTTVVLDGRLFGKPEGPAEAEA